MSEASFRVTVYDKTFTRRGWVGDPESLRVVVRHNGIGSATLVVRADHARVPDLAEKGARVVIEYKGSHLLSGMARLVSGEGGAAGTLTFEVVDDFRLLHAVLGWPSPASAITSQTSEYDVRTGPAETVVKGFATANMVNRLGLPVTVPASLGRGATISVKMRMHPLADRLFPVVDQAGIGVTLRQSGAGFVLDCYEPSTYPRTLSYASGVVTEWGYSSAAPEVTRVVAGNQRDGAARVFRQSVDAAREAAWGDGGVGEVFLDARDTTDTTETDARMAELLADGAPKTGLRVALSETANFRYDPTGQNGVRVGDVVALDIGGLEPVTDVLREAELSWTPDSGVLVRPVVGERSDDPSRVLAQAIASIAQRLRNREVR